MKILVCLFLICVSVNLHANDTTIRVFAVMSSDANEDSAMTSLQSIENAYNMLNISNTIKLDIINKQNPMLVNNIPSGTNMTAFTFSRALMMNNRIASLRELRSADVIVVFIGAPLLDA